MSAPKPIHAHLYGLPRARAWKDALDALGDAVKSSNKKTLSIELRDREVRLVYTGLTGSGSGTLLRDLSPASWSADTKSCAGLTNEFWVRLINAPRVPLEEVARRSREL